IQIRSKMDSKTESITFEQLAELDDEGLAILFREVDPEVTLVALAGASSDFVDRVMRPLPPRDARTLRRRMERLGPIRLSDIAAAQREVAQAATRLVEDGRLPRFVTPRFAVAA
ncbi:MAG: FliG C-terminal domain-containing protein, partial [Pirellulaceae bacterium]|nr:FliG C-terminal domain-containing protein [Pirellulaceae bacterium]